MAKKSAVEKNKQRIALVAKLATKRAKLIAVSKDKSLPDDERWLARLQLAQLPRDSSKIRIRNRCEVSGRPRAVYRKFRMSRIALRDLASAGKIPGVVKSSW